MVNEKEDCLSNPPFQCGRYYRWKLKKREERNSSELYDNCVWDDSGTISVKHS